LLTEPESQILVETAERYADAATTIQEIETLTGPAWNVAAYAEGMERKSAGRAALFAANENAWKAAIVTNLECHMMFGTIPRQRQEVQAALVLRDLFPLPHARIDIASGWLRWNDGTVRRIAQSIYDERKMPEGTLDTCRLAVLADALLDAGCDDEALIQHCRSEGPHVRGCWAIDLMLEKE
jgi:hypothetical protein